jgi:hypothetical protein
MQVGQMIVVTDFRAHDSWMKLGTYSRGIVCPLIHGMG